MSTQGKMNWQNLSAYTVQAADMEKFQSYMTERLKDFLIGARSPGVVYGGLITPTSGLQFTISAGVAIMPDRTLVAWDEITTNIDSADPTHPRIDRVELSYSQANGEGVVDVNDQPKTLDFTFDVSAVVVAGTPGASPVIPAKNASNISLGSIQLNAGSLAISAANVSQNPDVHDASELLFGNLQGKMRFNRESEVLEFSNDGLIYAPFGSGGGGGAGANWRGGALEAEEFGEKVWMFTQGGDQKLTLYIKVPNGYQVGNQVKALLGFYSISATDEWRMQIVTTLIRKGQDAIDSTVNQETNATGDIINDTAKEFRDVELNLTSATGQVNGVSIGAGDLLKLELTRLVPVDGTEDSEDIRFIPSATEVKFS